MTSSDHPVAPDAPLDDVDAVIMAGVRRYWDTVDPVPSWLVEQIGFALDFGAVDVEISRLVERRLLAAARGDEPTPMITFQSSTLTIMVTIGPMREGNLRIDGWLVPAAAHRIELRTTVGPIRTAADDHGRFSFDAVPAGFAQLAVHLTGTSSDVVTPSFSL